jgi:hypothetical protein
VSVLVPLYGFLQGDTIGLLVLVHDTDTVAEIARKLQQAAAVRLSPKPGGSVYHEGRPLDPALTVAQAGLTALERIDVIQEAE